MGRFWNEEIYKNELARRCKIFGFQNVLTEEPIKAIYKDFCKTYKFDILINQSVIYELKTANTLTGEHQKQLLNYLLLLGLQRGKLVNMRGRSVESRFVSTSLTPADRYDFVVEDHCWKNLDEDSAWLKQLLISLLNEWGAFLELRLFYSTIMHFHKNKENVLQKIKVTNNSYELGKQKIYALNREVAFQLSANTKYNQSYERHLQKFIRFTPFKAIQWINFNHRQIEFTTILK